MSTNWSALIDLDGVGMSAKFQDYVREIFNKIISGKMSIEALINQANVDFDNPQKHVLNMLLSFAND